MKNFNLVIIFFIASYALSCGSTSTKQLSDAQLSILNDMKNTEWLKLDRENRYRAVKEHWVTVIESKSYSELKREEKILMQKNKKWLERAMALYNLKVKYIDEDKSIIYAEGSINVSDMYITRYLLFKIMINASPTYSNIVFYHWRCYYPRNGMVRFYEQELNVNKLYFWKPLKDGFNSIIWSWENHVLDKY